MGKRKSKSHRSLTNLPKGLPTRKQQQQKNNNSSIINPFETTRPQRSKFGIHNGIKPKLQSRTTSLQQSLQRRRIGIKNERLQSKKHNNFIDNRIGENDKDEYGNDVYNGNDNNNSGNDKHLARIVRERVRRISQRKAKFHLNDSDDGNDVALTHNGRLLSDTLTSKSSLRTPLDSDSDSDSDNPHHPSGRLSKADTELHFGGGVFTKSNANPYTNATRTVNLGEVYRSRREEMQELIAGKKRDKAARQAMKESQVDKFTDLDATFSDLAALLSFRDKDAERREKLERKREGRLGRDEVEMEEWDKSRRTFQFEGTVKAMDREKSVEEVAREEAERLKELEEKRVKRMRGEFEGDDLSDVESEEEEDGGRRRKKKMVEKRARNDDELDEEDDEKDTKGEVRFTSEGLVYLDKNGNPIDPPEEDDDDDDGSDSDDDSSDDDDDDSTSSSSQHSQSTPHPLPIGTRISGNYRAADQYMGQESWYDGVVTKVTTSSGGKDVCYDVLYDDGDTEEGMLSKNVKLLEDGVVIEDGKKESRGEDEEMKRLKVKRRKAKIKASQSLPFTFPLPTTLTALHDIISQHATTGSDATTIIQRIYTCHSPKVDPANLEKMQNFYDVLLRRFILVGDAIWEEGDGDEVKRAGQLDELVKLLYKMTQSMVDVAGRIWVRRVGVLHRALEKRLRDASLGMTDDDDDEEEEFSCWPSLGEIFLLKALGRLFPTSDYRHAVVTPAYILLGQALAQCPVRNGGDVGKGLMCAGLMLEYGREARRVVPEAMMFLGDVLGLFGMRKGGSLTKFDESLADYRHGVIDLDEVKLTLEREFTTRDCFPTSVLCTTLCLINRAVQTHTTTTPHETKPSHPELFSSLATTLLTIHPSSLPPTIRTHLLSTTNLISTACDTTTPRPPLQRRHDPHASTHPTIPSLAPRMDDIRTYNPTNPHTSQSKQQALINKTRKDAKREKKQIARELKLDAMVEADEMRREREVSDEKKKEERLKNYAWLEGEQATMNQQVRMGGGLLTGGGTGVARRKARSGKMGIKKGGKLKG